jgi:hypothetical protein
MLIARHNDNEMKYKRIQDLVLSCRDKGGGTLAAKLAYQGFCKYRLSCQDLSGRYRREILSHLDWNAYIPVPWKHPGSIV